MIGLLVLLVHPPRVAASLVITAYRDHAIYVASDTLVSELDGTPQSHEKKVFQLGDTCLAAWTGLVRLGPKEKACPNQTPSLYGALEKLCREYSASREPRAEQEDKLVREITREYRGYIQWALTNGASPADLNGERLRGALSFAGYDPASKVFFGRTYCLQGTNEVSGRTDFNIGLNVVGASVGFQGESHFLSALVYGHDKKLTALCPKKYQMEISELLNPAATISEERLVDCLLEMLRLHQRHAARLGYDKGFIGEPYVVYKVTAEKITQIEHLGFETGKGN